MPHTEYSCLTNLVLFTASRNISHVLYQPSYYIAHSHHHHICTTMCIKQTNKQTNKQQTKLLALCSINCLSYSIVYDHHDLVLLSLCKAGLTQVGLH